MIASGCGRGIAHKAMRRAEVGLACEWDRTDQARDNVKGADSDCTVEEVAGLTGGIAGGSILGAGEASTQAAGEGSPHATPAEGEEQNEGSTLIDRSNKRRDSD